MKEYKIKFLFTSKIRLYEAYKIFFFTFWGHIGDYTSYDEVEEEIKKLNSVA